MRRGACDRFSTEMSRTCAPGGIRIGWLGRFTLPLGADADHSQPAPARPVLSEGLQTPE